MAIFVAKKNLLKRNVEKGLQKEVKKILHIFIIVAKINLTILVRAYDLFTNIQYLNRHCVSVTFFHIAMLYGKVSKRQSKCYGESSIIDVFVAE